MFGQENTTTNKLSVRAKKILIFLGILIFAHSIFVLTLCPDYISCNTKTAKILLRDDFDTRLFLVYAQKMGENDLYNNTATDPPPYPEFAYTYFLLVAKASNYNEVVFRIIHSLVMALCYVGLIYVTLRLLSIFKRSEFWCFSYALPAFLYFTPTRFDVLLAFLVSLSLLCLFKKNIYLSFLILTTAALFKWYPFLLFPFFLIYALKTMNKKRVVSALILCIIIFLSIQVLTVTAGNDLSIVNTYLWQQHRWISIESLYYFIGMIFNLSIGNNLSIDYFASNSISVLYFLCQIITIGIGSWLFSLMPAKKNILVSWCVLAILFFLLFSEIYSTGWLIWFVPLLILVLPNKYSWSILSYDILSYLCFPLSVFFINNKNFPIETMILLASVRTIILIMFIFIILRTLQGEQKLLNPLKNIN